MMIKTHVAHDDEPMGYTETCKRCRGKQYRWFTENGITREVRCGTCKGLGEVTYTESAAKRMHKNEMAKARKKRKLAEAIEAFKAEYPKVWAWMDKSSFPFAGEMKAALMKWGGLTDNQMKASLRCIQYHG